MQIKYGTSRIVLLVPSLGIAIKFPRIYGGMLLKQLWHGYLKRGYWKGLWWFMTAPATTMCSFRYMLFNGLVSNVSEFWFYLKTRNAFAYPTYFSLLGICNVQKLGVSPPFGEAWHIYHAIVNICGNDVKDSHCFSDVANFALSRDGALQLLDYASPNSQLVLRKYERDLREQFANYHEKMSRREELRKDAPFY